MSIESTSANEFSVSYNAKDVILYALSIGFGSSAHDDERDLRFLYEEHDEFTVVPTFCLALIFWAQNNGVAGNFGAIPTFPPPMMESMGILPKQFLLENVSIDEYLIIHTAQAISWSQDMPVPRHEKVRTILRGKFLSVDPKSVGTFVTTETEIFETSGETRFRPLCTIRSTALVLGLPSEIVIPFKGSSFFPYSEGVALAFEWHPLFELDCDIGPTTTLLYRLAAGDTNRIHVDPSAVPLLASDRDDSHTAPQPLLHGLCTLGIATRSILQFMTRQEATLSVRHLEGRFVKPVFVNDAITVQAWKAARSYEGNVRVKFTVRCRKTGAELLKNGRMELASQSKELAINWSRL